MSLTIGTLTSEVTHIRLGTAQTEVHNAYVYRDSQLQLAWNLPALPNIVSFTATPNNLPASQNVGSSTISLAWNVTGATGIEIKHANGNIAVASTQPTGSTNVSASGIDTVYTLEATNSTGTTTAFVHYWRSVPAAINSFTLLRSGTAPAGAGLNLHTIVLQIQATAHPWIDEPFTVSSTPAFSSWTNHIVNRAFRNMSGNTRTGTVQLTRPVGGAVHSVVYNLSFTNNITTATASLTVNWP